jgi:hypothetical protein
MNEPARILRLIPMRFAWDERPETQTANVRAQAAKVERASAEPNLPFLSKQQDESYEGQANKVQKLREINPYSVENPTCRICLLPSKRNGSVVREGRVKERFVCPNGHTFYNCKEQEQMRIKKIRRAISRAFTEYCWYRIAEPPPTAS